jgi:hypothetical protein
MKVALEVLNAIGALLAIAGAVWAVTGPHLPEASWVVGRDRGHVVIALAICTWILYGVFWRAAEWCFGWNFGPGLGGRYPAGWAAIALSVSVTAALAVVPPIYQRVMGVRIITDAHWKAMILVVVLGALAHLLVYGTAADRPNGIRQRIIPQGEGGDMSAGILAEAAYALIFFPLIIFPYRWIVDPGSPLLRTLLSAFAFFIIMTCFILVTPQSTGDTAWAPARGIIGAAAMMLTLCAGMFL